MKKVILSFFLCPLFFISCDNNDLLETSNCNNAKVTSGSLNVSELPYTVDFEGKKITFELVDSVLVCDNKLRTAGVWDGPFYATGDKKKILSNAKIVLNTSGYGGIYFCDVYYYYKTIKLPINAFVGKITLPTPCGYKNYNPQVSGINWSLSVDSNGTSLAFSFYTLAINYNLLGQSFGGRVIPVDGGTVKVPYYYMTE